jgi:hypothetical protein
MAEEPGVFIEHCDSTQLRFRVVPGGTREGFLRQLGSRPYNDWVLSDDRVLVRPGHVAVTVGVRKAGDDLVVEFRPAPAIDADAGIRRP